MSKYFDFTYVDMSWEDAGWLMDDAPNSYVPVDGLGVAHDVMEHMPGDQGTFIEELQALGTIFLVRTTTEWARQTNACEVLGRQLLSLALVERHNPIEEPTTIPYIRTYPLRNKKVENYIQETAEAMTSRARQYHDYDRLLVEGFRHACIAWMRRGYRRSSKYYRGIRPEELSATFDTISSEVNERFSLAPEVGDRIHISIHRKPTFHAHLESL